MPIQSKDAIAVTAEPSAWNIPFYRSAALSLFLSEMGISAAQPLLTLFFVTHLDVSPSIVSLTFLTALAGPPVTQYSGSPHHQRPVRATLSVRSRARIHRVQQSIMSDRYWLTPSMARRILCT